MSEQSLTFKLGGELAINRMGYGAMRITGHGIWGPPTNRAEALRVLQRAIELGVNFIDTADSYGPNISEELIAEALYPYPVDLVIGTKGGLLRTGPNEWPINSHPDHLKDALKGSLERLKLDQIDLYQLHRIDPEVPYEKSLEFLQQAQEEKLIKHIGLSEVTVEQIEKAREYVSIASVQNRYSVEDRKYEPELEFCVRNNIAFIPWYPLGGGNVNALEKLSTIAAKYKASAQQIALSWLLQHAPTILLIPGTSKVKHLEENIEASTISLSEEDVQALEQLRSAATSG